MKKISFVIPTTGKNNNLQKLVDSIGAAKFSADAEIIIVFNAITEAKFNSFKNSLNCINRSLKIYLLKSEGVNRARNFGVEQATGELIYFLDDDIIIDNNELVEKHLLLHSQFLDIFAFGGGYKLVEDAGVFDRIYNIIQMSWFYRGYEQKHSNNCYYAKYLLGGNFSVKRSVSLKNKIMFDEAIAYGSSEYDFFIRAKKQGLLFVTTDLEVLHHTSENFFSIVYKVVKQGIGKRYIDDRIKDSEVVEPSDNNNFKYNLTTSILLKFYNYCYWYGYYFKDSKILKILKILLTDFIGYLNYKRYQIIDKFKN